MKSSEIIQPKAISQPIANEGTRFEIPETATGSELASIQTGFPDITMKSLADGGKPPRGQDCNGMFYLSTDQRVFLQNGGIITFNQDVSDTIGGYPKGAALDYFTGTNYTKVQSLIDDNTYNFVTNPSYINGTYWQAVKMTVDTENLLTKTQVTNCILTSENPSITTTSYTETAYVNNGCTIDSDNIVTGFSTSNSILLNKTFTTSTSYTFTLSFMLDSATGTQPIAAINNISNCIAVIDGRIAIVHNGNAIEGETTLKTNTKYNLQLVRTATDYTLSLKTEGDTDYTTEVTESVSTDIFGGKSVYLGRTIDNYLYGAIYLGETTITADGTTYWDISTTADFEAVTISGTYYLLMPNGRNADNSLNNQQPSLTINETLLYSPVDGEKTVVLKNTKELMVRDYYAENFNQPDDIPLNGVWLNQTSNTFYAQVSTEPNILNSGVTLTEGTASGFSQTAYLELPATYSLGTSWSMSLLVDITENSENTANFIMGNAVIDETRGYMPNNIAIVYGGASTVTAYLRREDVYEVKKSDDTGDIIGYTQVAGTTLVPEGTIIYSDADLTTVQGTAAGTDYVYSESTFPSLITKIETTVTTGTNTLNLSYDGQKYTFNDTEYASSDTIRNGFNVIIGAAPSVTDGYFNSTIDLKNSRFSFWTWNGISESVQTLQSFVGTKIGTITDNGTNITGSVIYPPVSLAKQVDLTQKASIDLDNLSITGGDNLRTFANCLYEGRDLTVVLADEIAAAGDLYTVLHNRCQNADYSGINLLDYFDIPLAGGTVGDITVPAHTARMRIYGFDTYYNMGDEPIPHHIDFLNDYTIGVSSAWNLGNTNNGTSSVQNPWLSSRIYAICNGVNNYSTSAQGSLKHGLNCSSGGILQMLPESLQNVIITKRMWGDKRYSSSAQLTYDSGYDWMDFGKVWIPHETEIYSYQPVSYIQGVHDPLSRMLSVMYPGSRYRTRVAADPVTGGRAAYWLCCPSGYSAANVCNVSAGGRAYQYTATYTYTSVRFGFRIA